MSNKTINFTLLQTFVSNARHIVKHVINVVTLWTPTFTVNAAGGLSEASDSEMLGFIISAFISMLIVPMGLVHGFDRIGVFAYLHIPLIAGAIFLLYKYLRNQTYGKFLKSTTLIFSYILITFTTNILIKVIWYN